MSIDNELTIGSIVKFRIGRNTIEAIVLEKIQDGWKVRNTSTGNVITLYNNDNSLEVIQNAEPSVPEEESATPAEAEEEEHVTNPAPESGDGPKPEKKLSLINAAAKVLKDAGVPLNTKEMVEKAIETGLWIPTGAKTPAQTLYSGIFREINGKENPRFKKSETGKGAFEYAK